MTYRYFGLDGEMSSADLDAGGRLIQLGVTAHQNIDGTDARGDEAFSVIFNPGPNDWALIAEGVHGFSQAEIAAAMPATEADDLLAAWLIEHGADPKRRGQSIPVGFNVGAFDMPHVAAVLPKTSALFSRRTVDLNALCFTLEGFAFDGEEQTMDWWILLSKFYATRTIATLLADTGTQAHDAGYDALLHLHAWRFLRSVTHGEPFEMPTNIVEPPRSQTRAGALIARFGLADAATRTGIPAVVLNQWCRGGRAANPVWVAALEHSFDTIPVTVQS
jgi:hypothetical protein